MFSTTPASILLNLKTVRYSFNQTWKQSFKQSFTPIKQTRQIHKFPPNHGISNSTRNVRKISTISLLLVGSSLVFSTLSNPPILNQPVYKDTTNLKLDRPIKYNTEKFKLNYNELTLGSITGLFLGVIVGSLSSVLVFLSMGSYLAAQFLENRGIISIPWSSVVSFGGKKIDFQKLFFEQVCFKVSFVLSFIIAAYNI